MAITTTDQYFPTKGGRIKVQVETILGAASKGPWIYQSTADGDNPGAQGAGYFYFKSQTDTGSVKKATEGLFQAKIYIEEAGLYDLRVRAARDSNDPGDSRNDIWVKVDADTRPLLPTGTVPVESVSGGFLKLKGVNTKWTYANSFSAAAEADSSPPAQVMLSEGYHTITFAGRSVGLHIDFFEIYRHGLAIPATAPNTPKVGGPDVPDAAAAAEDSHVVIDVRNGDATLTTTALGAASHGAAVINADQTVTYTPDPDFFGPDSFNFTVRDAAGQSYTRIMTVTVADTPDAPRAVYDEAIAGSGAPVKIDVRANDYDPDKTAVAIHDFDATSGHGGTVALVGDKLQYTSAPGFLGTDNFTYDVYDATGRVSNRATVQVTVQAEAPSPVLVGIYDTDTDSIRHVLKNGESIDAATLGAHSTFVLHVKDDGELAGQVGSVKMTLSGAATAVKTDNSVPYALFGDTAGDLLGNLALKAGSYHFKVEAFSGASGKGTLLDSFNYDFTVTGTPPQPVEPVTVGLYDTATDTLVKVLHDGDVLDAGLLKSPTTFVAHVAADGKLAGLVGSVALELSGDAHATKIESGVPYALFGDNAGDLLGGKPLGAGSYHFSVDAFSKAGAKGALLDSFDFDFTVANPSAPAVTPVTVGLYDSDTETLTRVLHTGDVLDAAALADSTTFVVHVAEAGALAGKVGSIKLALSGDATAARTELGVPYALFGDDAGDLKGGLHLAAGSYHFDADVFSGAGGKGTLLGSFDYDFTVADPLAIV